jgi:aminopeptidase N
MRTLLRPATLLAATLLAVGGLPLACRSAPAPSLPEPPRELSEPALPAVDPAAIGAPGIGDPYYPGLGNGGYDVRHYEIALDVDMETDHVDAQAAIDALALQELALFHLDLSGMEVHAVAVDGAPATFRREGSELVVRPAAAIRSGASFRIEVRYSGKPEMVPDPGVPFVPGVGWWRTESGVYVVSECVGAQSWFPCNDHPSDKATFAVRIAVDAPYVAVSNGLLVEEREEDGRRTYAWRARDPMATYLATVAIAEFDVRREEGPGGVPLRLFHPPDATEEELAAFARTPEMLAYFTELFGPYPFEAFGAILGHEPLGGALETQTIPIYSRGATEETVAHELAHQWFGNCVALELWRDMWLNEGFASYAEWIWLERVAGPDALRARAARVHEMLREREVGPPFDPGVAAVFSARVYARGAWVLHALRGEVGDERFFAILREWVERHHDGNASTADFVALAEELAGRELDAFFAAWLYGARVPDLPALEAEPAPASTGTTDEEEGL